MAPELKNLKENTYRMERFINNQDKFLLLEVLKFELQGLIASGHYPGGLAYLLRDTAKIIPTIDYEDRSTEAAFQLDAAAQGLTLALHLAKGKDSETAASLALSLISRLLESRGIFK